MGDAERHALREELAEEAIAVRFTRQRAEEREWRHQALLQHANRELERSRKELHIAQGTAQVREEALGDRLHAVEELASERETELASERQGFRALVRAQLAEMAPRALQ